MPSVETVNRYVLNENLKRFAQARGSNSNLTHNDKSNLIKSQKITTLRTIKSAPFKKRVDFTDNRPKTSKADTSRGILFDQIDNASLFSSDSKSSIVNYNYKMIPHKYPSLNKQAEQVRRNLFKNYMKAFKETNAIYNLNESLLDKNQKKNATSEIHGLISSFKRDETNQAFLKRYEDATKSGEDKSNKIKKLNEKAAKEVDHVNTLGLVPTESSKTINESQHKKETNKESNINHENTIPLNNQVKHTEVVKRISYNKEKKIAEEEIKNPNAPVSAKVRRATFDLSKISEQYQDLTMSNLEIFTEEAYETLVNEDPHKMDKTEENLPLPSPSIGYELFDRYKNDDEKFYNKNKKYFMEHFEQGNLAINNFARFATQNREKCFKNTFKETPHAHTAKELKLNADSLKNELKRIRLAKLLAINNNNSKNDSNMKNKEFKKSQYFEDDDDDEFDLQDGDDEEEEDNLKNKDALKKQQFQMRVKKRQHYQVLLKYMYEKAQKNKIKIDSILNKYQYGMQSESESRSEIKIPETIATKPNDDIQKQSNSFCISIPFKRDNISNYEIFIPKHSNNSQKIINSQLVLVDNSVSLSSSSSFSMHRQQSEFNKFGQELIKSENRNIINQGNKELPLNYESLKISGLKVIESKLKSNFWENYKKN